MNKYTDLEAKELSTAPREELESYVRVDVRTAEEFAEGHIPGAIHIPHDEMESRFGELIPYKSSKILLICRSGRRSVMAAEVLSKHGFDRLFNLKGGMLEWTGPVERK
jgi:rhodanese-related sulfurtransferase